MLVEDLQPGAVVGEYCIERPIGEGSFGKVYAAIHPVIGKSAAVKVLGIEYASKPQFVSRFVEEARAVNLIRHRHIVDIFGFGSLPDGRPYFVMELLEGVPLGDYLKQRGRLPLGEALPILHKVARALDAAHGAGIAHRDLKPDNVFLSFDEDGTCYPKLLDFGIAKLMGSSPAGHRTATGTPMGTPLYMSPEQCKGESVDHRTDIYAFGILVYQVLTGRLPFDVNSVAEIMMAHLSQDPAPMSTVASDLPATLDGPVLQMLAKQPQDRPPRIGAAMEALVAAARQAGLVVPSVAASEAASPLAAPPAGSPEAATGPTEPATPGMMAESDGAAAAPPFVAGAAAGQPDSLSTQPSPGHTAMPATHPAAGPPGVATATPPVVQGSAPYGAAAWAGAAGSVAAPAAPPAPGQPIPGQAVPGDFASAGHSSGAGHHPAVGVAPQAPVGRRRGGWPPWLTWVLLGGGLLLFLALALIVVSAAMMAKAKGRRGSAISPSGGGHVALSATYRVPSSRVSSST
ncbi:MAG: protein kinase [Deltaproteobacteria bacterium]|nr:protein kinase [Deltaproteobacteria bacterium]